MLSLLTTLFFSALYAVAFAAPSLVKRIVVDPPITSPDASTVWTVGSSVTVTWNTSVIPPEAQNSTGTLVLGFQTSDSENLQLDDPLAKGFLLTDGSVQITVPDVTEKSNYIVVLFGDSGNASPEFTITGGSPSSSSASDSTSSSSASSSISGASTSTETVVATTATTETVPTTTSTGTAVVVTATSESSLSTVLSASSTASGSEASSSSAASITTVLSTSTAEASSTASAGTAVADSTNDGLSARAHGLGMPLVVSGVAVIVAFVL